MNMTATDTTVRTVGRAAWFAAWIGTVLGPIHALSRYATAEGAGDLASPLVRAWAEPAAQLLRPVLDWSDPDTVYVTFGKVWFPVVLGAVVCAVTVWRRSRRTGAPRWPWRITLVGYGFLTAGVLGTYWTPWLEQSFAVLVVPGVLISAVGSTVLGIALLRRGFRPRGSAWLLALWIPLFILLSSITSMGVAVLPMVWAWALAGRRAGSGAGAQGRDAAEPAPAPVAG